jgi:hypothetical protein
MRNKPVKIIYESWGDFFGFNPYYLEHREGPIPTAICALCFQGPILTLGDNDCCDEDGDR